MFVAVVHFPPVPAQRDAEFRAWFAWSNDQLSDSHGLASRRLLRDGEGGYVGLVEHESAAAFTQMHASPAASEVQRRLHAMIDGAPRADVYEVLDATAVVSGCCGGTGGREDTAVAERVEVSTAGRASCCHSSWPATRQRSRRPPAANASSNWLGAEP